MTASLKIDVDPADLRLQRSGAGQPKQSVDCCKANALTWPASPSERTKVFEIWETSAMHCLRSSPNGFAAIVSLRKQLRSDGTITATNRELVAAAGCSAKAFDRDLSLLKAGCLVDLTFGNVKGISGARRVIRLSMPAPDGTGSRI